MAFFVLEKLKFVSKKGKIKVISLFFFGCWALTVFISKGDSVKVRARRLTALIFLFFFRSPSFDFC